MGLSPGAIAGIAIASAVVLAVTIVLIVIGLKRRWCKFKKTEGEEDKQEGSNSNKTKVTSRRRPKAHDNASGDLEKRIAEYKSQKVQPRQGGERTNSMYIYNSSSDGAVSPLENLRIPPIHYNSTSSVCQLPTNSPMSRSFSVDHTGMSMGMKVSSSSPTASTSGGGMTRKRKMTFKHSLDTNHVPSITVSPFIERPTRKPVPRHNSTGSSKAQLSESTATSTTTAESSHLTDDYTRCPETPSQYNAASGFEIIEVVRPPNSDSLKGDVDIKTTLEVSPFIPQMIDTNMNQYPSGDFTGFEALQMQPGDRQENRLGVSTKSNNNSAGHLRSTDKVNKEPNNGPDLNVSVIPKSVDTTAITEKYKELIGSINTQCISTSDVLEVGDFPEDTTPGRGPLNSAAAIPVPKEGYSVDQMRQTMTGRRGESISAPLICLGTGYEAENQNPKNPLGSNRPSVGHKENNKDPDNSFSASLIATYSRDAEPSSSEEFAETKPIIFQPSSSVNTGTTTSNFTTGTFGTTLSTTKQTTTTMNTTTSGTKTTTATEQNTGLKTKSVTDTTNISPSSPTSNEKDSPPNFRAESSTYSTASDYGTTHTGYGGTPGQHKMKANDIFNFVNEAVKEEYVDNCPVSTGVSCSRDIKSFRTKTSVTSSNGGRTHGDLRGSPSILSSETKTEQMPEYRTVEIEIKVVSPIHENFGPIYEERASTGKTGPTSPSCLKVLRTSDISPRSPQCSVGSAANDSENKKQQRPKTSPNAPTTKFGIDPQQRPTPYTFGGFPSSPKTPSTTVKEGETFASTRHLSNIQLGLSQYNSVKDQTKQTEAMCPTTDIHSGDAYESESDPIESLVHQTSRAKQRGHDSNSSSSRHSSGEDGRDTDGPSKQEMMEQSTSEYNHLIQSVDVSKKFSLTHSRAVTQQTKKYKMKSSTAMSLSPSPELLPIEERVGVGQYNGKILVDSTRYDVLSSINMTITNTLHTGEDVLYTPTPVGRERGIVSSITGDDVGNILDSASSLGSQEGDTLTNRTDDEESQLVFSLG